MTIEEFTSSLYLPVAGDSAINSNFGNRGIIAGVTNSTFHKGLDLKAAIGDNVLAAQAGKVIKAGWGANGAGYMVTIDHGNGYVTKYMHNSKINVKVGDTVTAGQVIAQAGKSGQVTAEHIHFQIEKDGVAVDPTKFRYVNANFNNGQIQHLSDDQIAYRQSAVLLSNRQIIGVNEGDIDSLANLIKKDREEIVGDVEGEGSLAQIYKNINIIRSNMENGMDPILIDQLNEILDDLSTYAISFRENIKYYMGFLEKQVSTQVGITEKTAQDLAYWAEEV